MSVFIIFDLEATCNEQNTLTHETIEIGAVKVNERGERVDTFNCFVKPVLNPVLTNYCKELTSIKQFEVDQAETFDVAIKKFKLWMGEEYILCSWGFYDKKQLKQDCLLHQLETEWVEHHISLKHQYPMVSNPEAKDQRGEIKKEKRPMGLGKALRQEGMKFEGTQHRGIDDAMNISKLFVRYLPQWSY